MSTAAPTNPSGLPQLRLTSGGIPWRQTFLRRHLASELNDSREIFVLGDLRRHGPITPCHFFFNDPPYNLYQPIKMRPLDDENLDLVKEFRDKQERART